MTITDDLSGVEVCALTQKGCLMLQQGCTPSEWIQRSRSLYGGLLDWANFMAMLMLLAAMSLVCDAWQHRGARLQLPQPCSRNTVRLYLMYYTFQK